MLHKMNPVRVGFIRERVVRARQDEGQFSEERVGLGLEGMNALDVGCGGGLLSEVMLLSYEIAFLELICSSRVLQGLEQAH
jgi:2-polyprenyl-3-methyl-5-hydroxy-6-metoxy-1,4-benzoquinol methylase